MANTSLESFDKNIKIISEAETSCLALSSELSKLGIENIIAADERTIRMLSEKPENLEKLIRNGDNWPGANYILRPDGRRKKITPELMEEIILEIKPGYIVERHLQNGDIVLFNRHPSLHRASLMAHFVKVLPGRTFRMHPAVGLPYGADYDGDEMNIHSPQTEEAKAEARELLDVKKNFFSPKNYKPELKTRKHVSCTKHFHTKRLLLKCW